MALLRVGLIIDNGPIKSLAKELIDLSEVSGHYSINCLILQDTPTRSGGRLSRLVEFVKTRGVLKFLQTSLFSIITMMEKRFIGARFSIIRDWKDISLDTVNVEKILVKPQVSKSGFVYRFSDEDLDLIRLQKLDVLLRAGSGILRGEILTLCKYGILSFHHGDNDFYRGSPAGFWEIMNQSPSTGFVIQKLTEELDGGDVLFKGAVRTSPIYVMNLIKVLKKSNIFMHQILERIAKAGKLPEVLEKKAYSSKIYTVPTIKTQILYALRTSLYLWIKVWNNLVNRQPRWEVAYQFVDEWNSSVLWKSNIIKNPPNRFLADPFPYSKNGDHVCFVEDYDFEDKKGRISVYRINATGYEELGIILDEPFHLSYPFIFSDGEDIYMCPETHQIQEIRLYKCIDYPSKWEFSHTLLKNVSAVDTNIFKHDGRWWLMTNLDSSDINDRGSELHLFYSDSLDSGKWLEHPENPIIFDSLQARNGGLINDGSQLYRVFQRHGFDKYGESLGITRITHLSINNYSEEHLSDVEPKFFDGILGTHTFSYRDGLLLFDFVRMSSTKN